MLLRKLLRDLRKNKLSAVTIVCITALGIMLWTGFSGISTNGMAITADFYRVCAMPDLFVSGNRLDAGDIRDIRQNGGLEVMGRNVVDMTADGLDGAVLRLYAQEMPARLNKPIVLQGSLEGMDNPRNLLLDADFMEANGLRVGQKLRLRYHERFYEFHIIAAVRTPENIYNLKDVSAMVPDHRGFGYALTADSAVRDMLYGGEAHLYNQIVLTTKDPEGMKAFLSRRLTGKLLSATGRGEHVSASMVDLEFRTIGSIVGVFPTVFFLIAALISFTSLKRLIDKERTTIGTLKALGVKDWTVLSHYSSYGVLFGALAAAVGVPLGLLIPKAMFRVMDRYFALPPYTLRLNYATSVLAAVTAVAVSVAAALWACRGILSLPPSVCMRTKSAKPGKKILLERVRLLWDRLSDIRHVILRNLFRNKDRMLMSLFGVLCSCALLFIAFGMKSSIDHMMESVYEKVNCYDIKTFLAPGTSPAEARRVAALPQASHGELIMETGAKLTGRTVAEKTAAITVVPDNAQLLGIYEGRDLSQSLPAEGCILSDALARELGVGEGDRIAVRFTGRQTPIFLKVNKVIVQSFGQGVFVSRTAWRQAGEGFAATAALLRVKNGTDLGAFLTRLRACDFVLDAQDQGQMKASLESDMAISNVSISMLILFAGVMAFAVLFKLGVLNFYERERELATLKVVGFTDGEVRRMAFGENNLFVAVGGGAGLVLGNLGIDSMLSMVETEHFTFTKYVDLTTVAYSLGMLCLFSFLTNLLLRRFVQKIDVISALKAME